MSGAIRVQMEMLLAASEALASEVTQEDCQKGMIYPPILCIRKISAQVAASVAAKAYEIGVATRLPRPDVAWYIIINCSTGISPGGIIMFVLPQMWMNCCLVYCQLGGVLP